MCSWQGLLGANFPVLYTHIGMNRNVEGGYDIAPSLYIADYGMCVTAGCVLGLTSGYVF